MPDKQQQGMTEEQKVRLGVGVVHGLGTVIFSAFGAGEAAKLLGGLEETIISSAYADKIAPAIPINNSIREVNQTGIVNPTSQPVIIQPIKYEDSPIAKAMYGIK